MASSELRGDEVTIEAKPQSPTVAPDNIPTEMKTRDQWVCWAYIWKPPEKKNPGRWEKRPLRAGVFASNGKPVGASSTDHETWTSFDRAYAEYLNPKNGYDGIGYVFSGDPDDFTGVDLDDSRDRLTGTILPWTKEQRECKHWAEDAPEPQQIIERLRSYTEVSPSQTGVKVFVHGHIVHSIKHGSIEMYRSARYFTVTGSRLEGTPPSIADCNGVLSTIHRQFDVNNDVACTSRDAKPSAKRGGTGTPTIDQVLAGCENADNGDKFRRLFDGDITGYPSQSEAECALCCIVAFWCAGDASLIDMVFRKSKLVREKWDEKRGAQTYGERTIAAALEVVTEFYDWNRARSSTTLAGVTLIPKGVHRTTSKLTVQVELQREGKRIDFVKVTDAATARRAAVKLIVAHTGDGSERDVDTALGKLLAEAAAKPAKSKGDGKTVQSILAEHVPLEIDLRFSTDGGKAFSGALRQSIGRTQFVERFTNNSILQLAATADDAPRDDAGFVQRQQLIGVVEKELRILWGELLSQLRPANETKDPEHSQAAIEFRQSIMALWSRPKNLGIVKQFIGAECQRGRDSIQLASVNSLASRVRRMEADGQISANRWVAVQDGYDAYCRLEYGPATSEVRVRLAMRFVLTEQVGVTISGATDQTRLRELGETFQIIDPDPDVPDRMTGGTRLVVLALAVTDDILAVPQEDMEGIQNRHSDADRRATAVTD